MKKLAIANRALRPCIFPAALALALLMPQPAQTQESRLGRLFYTPEERAQLDQKRGVVTPVKTGPQTAIVNGIITRSGQAPIIFMDGKASRGQPTAASAQQQLNQGVPLRNENGQTFAAKPGQIVDLSSGRVIETYQWVPGMAETAPKSPPAPEADVSAPASTPRAPAPPVQR